MTKAWWTTPYQYDTISGGRATTTNLDELKIAVVVAPMAVAALIAAVGLFLVAVIAVDNGAFRVRHP